MYTVIPVSYTHLDVYKRQDNYKWEYPIRSLGIRAADLVLDDIPVQLDLFGNQEKKEKLEKLDRTVDAVSYTHLDVYKRQEYHPSGRSDFGDL